MFILNFSNISSLFFFLLIYVIFILSFSFYLTPTLVNFRKFFSLKKKNSFFFIKGLTLFKVIFFYFFFIFFLFFLWTAPVTSIWFGHLTISSFNYKVFFFIFFFFFLIVFSQSINIFFSNKEIFDYFISIFNFFLWTLVLFFTNNIFSSIFVIEILSTLIFLILITSTFNNSYFFNNLNLNLHSYLHNSLPFFFNQTVLFYFWTSLLASLNLFLSILFLYLKFYTFDWFFFENFFYFILLTSSIKDILFILFLWFNFLFCIFLKCGLVPFYAWKPTFFKGSPVIFLYTYICFFYFFIFLFFIKLLIINFSEIFFFFTLINIFFLLIGILILLTILSETFYLKTFFAISSILNTLFVFLAFSTNFSFDFFFFI